MTEEENAIVLNIINGLDIQRGKIASLSHETMQDFLRADKVGDMDESSKALKEMKRYADAYDAVRIAINIFQDVKEGRL